MLITSTEYIQFFLNVGISDKLGMRIININIIYKVDIPFINYSHNALFI